MSPRAKIPSKQPLPLAPGGKPLSVEFAGIIGSILVFFGALGTAFGVFAAFAGGLPGLFTLAAGVSLLVSGMVLKVLVEIWKKIPGERQTA
ncbi:hypothetical protein [Corynebacterium flavescens]|uniref:hypothetical protein n=1 Tax=Corynebacterium flavescens TaxID=28028 RepID=UPI003FD44E4E